ncbi:hypothetical protein [Polymorphospora lycopeni]|uniref:Helix-turn-helix DNA binding domain protein n=1 Tax=Polymorphospora lycopeni TaxID=3140240 RepID=A0ABV5CL25_9ACTN
MNAATTTRPPPTPDAAPAYRGRRDVYKVRGRMVTADGLPVLDRKAVAELLGLEPKSISQYLFESRPGGRYEHHPFPAPDDRIGRAPWWRPERADEIREWAANRPGQGAGGGRPRRSS